MSKLRIHTSLDEAAIYAAARAARVGLERFTRHGSRTHDHAFDVILTGSSGRHMNSGAYGAMTESEAASWDEWGIFLGHLFAGDADLKSWAYADRADFNEQTDWRFDYVNPQRGLVWEDQHRHHHWEFLAPRTFGCKTEGCTATRMYPIHEQRVAS